MVAALDADDVAVASDIAKVIVVVQHWCSFVCFDPCWGMSDVACGS